MSAIISVFKKNFILRKVEIMQICRIQRGLNLYNTFTFAQVHKTISLELKIGIIDFNKTIDPFRREARVGVNVLVIVPL